MNIVKNHILKTFLLPGKVNGHLNNIFTLKKKNPYFWTCSQMHQKRYPIGFRSKKRHKNVFVFLFMELPIYILYLYIFILYIDYIMRGTIVDTR